MQNPTESATTRQTFAIFLALGYDVRNANLTKQEASEILGIAQMDKLAAQIRIAGRAGVVRKAKADKVQGVPMAAPATDTPKRESHAQLYKRAQAAGMEAGRNAQCVPMVVQQRASVLNNNSPVVHEYKPVMDGVCGFASVKIAGNTSFGKWAKAKGYARPAYKGGLSIYIGEHRQSLTRKEAHASAMAHVLCKAGVEAHCDSRID